MENKTYPSFTLGTNGFTILKDGNTITDQSSNTNNFTLGGGTLTKSEDNPSNVFATLNSLIQLISTQHYQMVTILMHYGTAGSRAATAWATLGMSYGKYYKEFNNFCFLVLCSNGLWLVMIVNNLNMWYILKMLQYGFAVINYGWK